MASSDPESQGNKQDNSDLAALVISDNEVSESELEGRFEEFKNHGEFKVEPSQNGSNCDEESYPYFSDHSIFECFDGKLKQLPELFPEESGETSEEESDVEYDDDNDNNTAVSEQTDLKRNAKQIDKSVPTVFETILFGFMMSVTEDVCRTGDIDRNRYTTTKNADKIIKQLEDHKKCWEGKQTESAIRMREVCELLTAIKNENYTDILKAYYRAQHIHILNDDPPTQIEVYIDKVALYRKWISYVETAIQSINDATPGLNLVISNNREASMIIIGVDDEEKTKSAYTKHGGNRGIKPFIHLGSEWSVNKMEGTSIHELMHALKFHHEMQRYDASLYVSVNTNNHNYKTKPIKLTSLTRYDPFSVMNYPENESMKRVGGDPIWDLKDNPARCQKLSELDKVALNMLYKPCRTEKYNPNFNNDTKMLYCGRKVMIDHNQVSKATTDYKCGPNNWANCAACRVIFRIRERNNDKPIPTLDKCLKMNKWQGLSGLFYCGKVDPALKADIKFSRKTATCGPDTGIPCHECGKMLYYKYSIKQVDEIFKK